MWVENLRQNFSMKFLGRFKINALFINLDHFLKRISKWFALTAFAKKFPCDVNLSLCLVVVDRD